MRNAFFSKLEFWQQLVIFFSTGIAVLAICTSVVLTITANNSLKSQLTGQSLYLTESLARQARLSLLYESPEEANDIVEIALQYPDVVGISIRTDKNKVLTKQGVLPVTDNQVLTPGNTALAEELENHLIFVSPVRTQVENDFVLHEEPGIESTSAEVIGYITLVISKSSLDQIWIQLLESNILVSTVVAIPLLILLIVLTRRLTNPLRSLSTVMHRAEQGELNLRASLSGPRDIGEMQKSFNTMMASLEKQTHELKIARDQALASAKVKSEFAANVSHELRTPMNSVLGMLELLSVMGLSEQQQEYLQTAKLSAQNLLALIDDILSYVRSDSGTLILDNGPCDIRQLLEEVIVLMSTQAMKKKLDIGYVIAVQQTNVLLDRQRLRQILINIIGNAIKFTDEGEISVLVDLSKNGESVVFTVTDTGAGISPEWIEKVFDAFTQEDATTTRKVGGTGLGLAICKQFVTLMGGDIWVDSEKGQGSTFIFTVPYNVRESDTGESDKPREEILAALEGKNAVVIDDSYIVRQFLSQWLGEYGAVVKTITGTTPFIELLDNWETEGKSLEFLFIDEELPDVKLDTLLNLTVKYKCCDYLSIICMVNPWRKSQYRDSTEYSILEKPLYPGRLIHFFNQSNQIISRFGIRERHESFKNRFNLNVLIVDDNQANCLVAGGMLDHLGCEFVTVYNGEEALEYVGKERLI